MKLTPEIERRISRIAEIADYGLEWVRDDENPDPNNSYRVGAIETVGHQIACMVCQWITNESEPTSDVIEALKLHECPKRATLERRLRKYVRGPQ